MHILYRCHKGGKMNRKLKKYANKQLKRYRNEDFLNELKSKQKEMKKNNDRKKFIPICLSTSSALVMLAVALLCVFLIKPPVVADDTTEHINKPTEQTETEQETKEKTYGEGNQCIKDSDLDELNSELKYFNCAFDGGDYYITRNVYSHNDETKYYLVTYTSEDGFFNVEIIILTNPNYNIDYSYMIYNKEGTIASHEIQYVEHCESDDDGMFRFTGSGAIITDKEKIYMNTDYFTFDEESIFIEMLNEIIIAK